MVAQLSRAGGEAGLKVFLAGEDQKYLQPARPGDCCVSRKFQLESVWECRDAIKQQDRAAGPQAAQETLQRSRVK